MRAQVVLYDMPGMHGARDFAQRSTAMRVAATWLHVQECDVYALIVDCPKQLATDRQIKKHHRNVEELARVLGSEEGPDGFQGSWVPKPVILLLNKADLLAKQQRNEVRNDDGICSGCPWP
jgi:GTPase Era involved in 16S rRNA processing